MSLNRSDFVHFVMAGSVAAGCPIDLALRAGSSPAAPRSTASTAKSAMRFATGTPSHAHRCRSAMTL